MSDMVEHVAHSLSLANQSPDVLIGDNWDIPGLVNKDGYRKLARSAITALREPTEEMLVAAVEGAGRIPELSEDMDFTEVWYAMIDEALK